MNTRAQAEINAAYAHGEFLHACQVIRSSVPSHEQLTTLLNSVESAALSFHEQQGFDGSGSVVDSIQDAQKSLEFCFHHTSGVPA